MINIKSVYLRIEIDRYIYAVEKEEAMQSRHYWG